MKRCLSLVLALIISVSVVLYCSSAVYSAAVEEYLIEGFVETGIDLIRENDADKEFEPEEIECETDDDDSSLQIINDNFSEEELPDIAFQTCRLIVKATKVPDKLNSIGVACGFKNWYIVQFENEEDAKEAYNIYLQDKSVLSVSPDRVYKSLDDITDEVETDVGEPTNSSVDCLNSQGSIYTGLYETKKYIEENSNSNTELVVGIVDTGVYLSNEFLSGKIVRTYFNACSDGYPDSEQADYARHGTEVGSIIVDNTPDNIKLAFYRSIDDTGNSSPAILALGIIAAVEDEVDVINTSFGSYDRSGILEDSVNEAISKGIVVISSSGNNHKHVMTRDFRFPACINGVITVGSSNSEGFYPSYFTNYGECVDILAPGENVPCAYKENQYGTCSGTSFSAPYVVSLFLQLKTMYPDLDNKSIERKIYASAFETDLLSDCELYGYGIICQHIKTGVPKRIKDIMEMLRIYCRHDPLPLYEDRIMLKNGTIFLDGKFIEENDFCMNRLPINYSTEAKGIPVWTKFINDLFYPEDIPTVQEYLGNLLIPSTRSQKMMLIKGDGGEGKSRIGIVLKKILGANMYSGALPSLEKSPYSRGQLEFRLLFLDDDLMLSALPETNNIKTIVTAEAEIDVERKYVQNYQTRIYSRLLAFGNGNLRSLYDKSKGFFRRQLIISTKPVPEGRENDPYLADKLCEEAEQIFW